MGYRQMEPDCTTAKEVTTARIALHTLAGVSAFEALQTAFDSAALVLKQRESRRVSINFIPIPDYCPVLAHRVLVLLFTFRQVPDLLIVRSQTHESKCEIKSFNERLVQRYHSA